MLAQTIGKRIESWSETLAKSLAEIGVGPNLLTVLGFVFTALAGGSIALRWLPVAMVLVILAGACDMLDGAVARVANKRTSFGAVLDSTIDRYSDTMLFVGIVYYFLDQPLYEILAVFAMAGSLATSYVRARSENLIPECRAGFWERGERVTYILIGITFNHLGTVVIILAIFSNLTVLQRLFYTWWELARSEGKNPWPHTEETADLVFWNYDRGAWQYDVAVIIFFAMAIFLSL